MVILRLLRLAPRRHPLPRNRHEGEEVSLIHRAAGRRSPDDDARRKREALRDANWDGDGPKPESGTLFCSDRYCQEGKMDPYFTVNSLMVDQWRNPTERLDRMEAEHFNCTHCGSVAEEVP